MPSFPPSVEIEVTCVSSVCPNTQGSNMAADSCQHSCSTSRNQYIHALTPVSAVAETVHLS